MNKLYKAFIATVSVTIFVVGLTTCSKDYSFEGGPNPNGPSGNALYSIDTTGGDCKGNLISGNYYINTPLEAANTIELKVNVTKIGKYSISTSAINGIQFSGSGNFSDTGSHIVSLLGTGTPLSQGSFVFSFPVPIGAGCFFTIVVEKKPVPIAKFTLAGAPFNCENVVVSGPYTQRSPLTNFNTVEINVDVTEVGDFTIHTDTVNGMSFSASGIFSKTGTQAVRLVGSGTPIIPGFTTFTPAVNGSVCNFNVAITVKEPPATYVLQSSYGTPAPCIYSVAGDYKINTPLSNSNTVSVSVYVTVPGNFTIATQKVNGITFVQSGYFTDLGSQNVILQGSGTPAVAGKFSIVPEILGPAPLGGAACGIQITVN